jgi:hypothetical protein
MRTCSGILFLTLVGTQAGALCNVPRPRLVCAEYFQSKAVVIATLAGVTPIRDSYDDVTGTYYSMTVERALRGQVPHLFRVYEANDSRRAKFDWTPGDSYLIFLREETPSGSWVIDGCGNSGNSERKQVGLEQIGAMDTTSDRAMIQVAVGEISSSYPLEGVQLEARGPDGVKTAETKADGMSEMHVTSGKYQVRALSPVKTFEPDGRTYENPDDLVLEKGACAQVQFVQSLKK